jgi:flagellar operon protein (TIGR03826 family)
MDVRNCKQCGRLFNYLGGQQICPVCKQQVEEQFSRTKEYIRENPKATIQEVADESEVSVQQIRQWIREERLEFSKDSPVGIECEMCGATIRTGRYCEACKNRMASNLTDAIAPPKATEAPEKKKEKGSDRMRFLQ